MNKMILRKKSGDTYEQKEEKMDLSSTSSGEKPVILGYVSILSIEIWSQNRTNERPTEQTIFDSAESSDGV